MISGYSWDEIVQWYERNGFEGVENVRRVARLLKTEADLPPPSCCYWESPIEWDGEDEGGANKRWPCAKSLSFYPEEPSFFIFSSGIVGGATWWVPFEERLRLTDVTTDAEIVAFVRNAIERGPKQEPRSPSFPEPISKESK